MEAKYTLEQDDEVGGVRIRFSGVSRDVLIATLALRHPDAIRAGKITATAWHDYARLVEEREGDACIKAVKGPTEDDMRKTADSVAKALLEWGDTMRASVAMILNDIAPDMN